IGHPRRIAGPASPSAICYLLSPACAGCASPAPHRRPRVTYRASLPRIAGPASASAICYLLSPVRSGCGLMVAKLQIAKLVAPAIFQPMQQWIKDYLTAQKAALDSIPVEAVEKLIETFARALREDRQIFVFGNGGSAANASHFVT